MDIQKLVRELVKDQFGEDMEKLITKEYRKQIREMIQKIAQHQKSLISQKSKMQKKACGKKSKRISVGYTNPETLVPYVEACLKVCGGAASKKELYKKIVIVLKAENKLFPADQDRHNDGQIRLYKTMDRARRLLVDEGKMKGVDKTKPGLWQLANT